MALKPCRECKQPVSTSADKCPHCGKPTPGFNGIGCLPTIVVLMLVVAGVRSVVNDGSPRPSPAVVPTPIPAPPRSPQELAPAACRIALEKQLHDPDSAEYLDLWKTVPVEQVDKIGYRVQQRVRAKNAFGAKVLSVFQCEFLAARDGLRVLSVKELR